MHKYWKNNKNKKIYEVLNVVVNTTNNRDGELMFLYTLYNESKVSSLFVREVSEFEEKFTKI